MRILACVWCALALCAGCGPRRAEVIRRLEAPAPSTEGPPPSEAEQKGEAPPLRSIRPLKPLLPPDMTVAPSEGEPAPAPPGS